MGFVPIEQDTCIIFRRRPKDLHTVCYTWGPQVVMTAEEHTTSQALVAYYLPRLKSWSLSTTEERSTCACGNQVWGGGGGGGTPDPF